jgi:hypothetical protein
VNLVGVGHAKTPHNAEQIVRLRRTRKKARWRYRHPFVVATTDQRDKPLAHFKAPDLDCSIKAARQHAGAVGRERDRPDYTEVAQTQGAVEGADQRSRGGVPQRDAEAPARQHAGAVGRQRHRSDRSGVALEDADERSRGGVPQLDGLSELPDSARAPSGENATELSILRAPSAATSPC